MTIEAELADGRILEFPDGTAPDVIQATVKRMLGPQKPPEATAGERGAAALGGVNRGVAGLLGLPVDTVENALNLGAAGVGTAATALGRPDLAPGLIKGSVGGSESIAALMEKLGIGTKNPRPDDTASRILNTAGMIAGGSVVPGAGIKSTAAAAAGGALAGEVLGPEYVGVGAMAPAAASQAAAAAKNAVASKASPNLATFRQAGTTPSVGQATESGFLQGLENVAAKFPGGAGVMRKFAEAQQASMGAKARTGVSAEDAGRTIEKGIKSPGGFIDRTRLKWEQLDDAVAAKVGGPYNVPPTNTMRALDELVAPVPGAEQSTSALVSKRINDIREGFRADTTNNMGAMPFEALRKHRSRVGAMIDDAMTSDIPTGELKKLYGALSKDMEAGAKAVGAGDEFARQNNYYRARMQRIEDVLEKVVGSGKQPEDIFKNFMPTDVDRANKVRAVMRSLEPAERKVVTEAVVNRLGRAAPGKQNELGDIFSSETFLTNWNKLSDPAKSQLFPNHAMRQQVETIAKAAANMREGGKVFQNVSGTAGSFAAIGIYSSPFVALGTGNVAPVATAAASAGTAYVGAKMLTNPKVVEWLARPINPAKPGEAQAHLARLSVIYNQSDEALKRELEQFVSSVK